MAIAIARKIRKLSPDVLISFARRYSTPHTQTSGNDQPLLNLFTKNNRTRIISTPIILPKTNQFFTPTSPNIILPAKADDRDPIDLDDHKKLFKSVTTTKLVRSSFNLLLAAMNPMVDVGMYVMRSRWLDTPLVRDAILRVVEHTFFEHFVAGQSQEEAGRTVEKIFNASGMRGMLDYAVEHTDDSEMCQRNLAGFLKTVDTARTLPKSAVSSIIAKISALCPMSLLIRVSHLLRWHQKNASFHLPWMSNTLPIFSESSPLYHTLEQPEPLSAEEEKCLEEGINRLHLLCQACVDADVPLSIDAEDTIVQPAIDYFTYSSAIIYNKNVDRPTIYGTIQAYRKDALERLHLITNVAHKMGVSAGVKLVRGAYISSERRLASALNVESPIHNTIEDTHECFNGCTNFMLDKISDGWKVHAVFASHNVDSGKMIASRSRGMGIKPENEKLQFAQLYGMSEALSFALRNEGFIVSKYMPFGPIELVLPYLLRRAEENRGLLSSSNLDRTLMRKELTRRFKNGEFKNNVVTSKKY